MKRFIITALAAVLFIVCALAVLADGKVVNGNTNPVTDWKIADLRFAHLDESANTAIIPVKFIRADGTVDHIDEIDVSGAEYTSLLAAINTSSGTDESTLTITTTNPDGTTTTSPDLAAIFRLRISRWMVSHSKITNVTAEPVSSTDTTGTTSTTT